MTDTTDIPQLDTVEGVIDALSDADLLQVYRTLLPFDDQMVTAAAVKRALAGGGGGTDLVTPDEDDDTLGITIKTGDSATGDSGDVDISTGTGDDRGSVRIQGDGLIVSPSGNVRVLALQVGGAGNLAVTDGDFGVALTLTGIVQILRGPDYPDIGANYLLFVNDGDTQHTWGVTPAGYEYFANPNDVGEPADADLDASQRRQWYDPTNGARAFRFKQKDHDGTVTVGKSAAMDTDGAAFLGVDKVSLTVGDAAEIMAALVTLGLATDDT